HERLRPAVRLRRAPAAVVCAADGAATVAARSRAHPAGGRLPDRALRASRRRHQHAVHVGLDPEPAESSPERRGAVRLPATRRRPTPRHSTRSGQSTGGRPATASRRGPIPCRKCRPTIGRPPGATSDPADRLRRTSMTRIGLMVIALLCLLAGVASAEVQRLYVLDCGRNLGRDQARWSPGVNEGKPIEFSDNCYLIRHDKGLLLWDTGVPDAVAAMPDGMVVANGAITYRRAKTLAAQLIELGVKPADVTYVAVSHTHGDHVGNIAL